MPPTRWRAVWAIALFVSPLLAMRTLVRPQWPSLVAFGLSILALALVGLRLRSMGDGATRALRAVLVVAFALVLPLLGRLVHEAQRPDADWTEFAQTRMDSAVEPLLTAMGELRQQASARARAALDPSVRLDSLATAIHFAGRRAEVGLSRFRGGELIEWAGRVPGPERVKRRRRPVIVDYGFRRYLTVYAGREDGSLDAYCDVDLGVLPGLFGRNGANFMEVPEGEVRIRLLAEASEATAGPGLRRVVPVGGADPWIYVEIEGPRPEQARRAVLAAAGRDAARALLLALVLVGVAAWRAWPGRRTRGRKAWITAVVLMSGLVLRVALDRAQVIDLAFHGARGTLRLLLEPAYFNTSLGFGLLRSTLDFLVTAAGFAIAAVLLLPAWEAVVDAVVRRRHGRPISALLLGAASVGLWELLAGLQEVVAQNANPTLIGLDSPFFTPPFVALHAAMLLFGLAPTLWVLWGWERWVRKGEGVDRVGLLLVSAALAAMLRWVPALGPPSLWLAVLPLVAAGVRYALRDRSFARRALAGLLALMWLSGVQAEGLERVYTGLKQSVAVQEAEQRLRPQDNWRPFLLEDLLRELSQDREMLRRLADPDRDRSNEAFVVWAQSSLRAHRSGCRIELRDDVGHLLSEFDVGLPYEPMPLRTWRQSVRMSGRPYRVDPVELATEKGPFLVYRGILDLEFLLPEGDASRLVIDLPYGASSPTSPIDLAVPVAAEATGLEEEDTLPPRRTFDRVILTARLEEDRVVAASDARLIGLPSEAVPDAGQWGHVDLGGEPYRVGRVEVDGASMVVAFVETRLGDRLLDLSRLAALYVLLAAIGLFGAGVARLLRARSARSWPRELGEIGFQERLLGAMLVTVLLPVFVLGVVQSRRGAERLREDHLEEVDERLDTALQLLASTLDDLAAALIGGEYVQDILATGNTFAPREMGPFDRGQLMIFSPTRELLLDETLRGFERDEAETYLSEIESGALLLEVDATGWFLGRAYPVLGPGDHTYHVYVRRWLGDEELARVARTVHADLTLYDGPWAVVSSQAYLFKAGLRAPILPVEARPVLDGRSRRVVEASRREGLVVANGYAVVPGPGEPQRGVLAATLLGRATEAAVEQKRAQLFVFGLSSLAMVLAVAVGLFFSSRIVGPIRALVQATGRVGRGELDLLVREEGSDEIGQLVRSFNAMTEDLRRSRRELAARRAFLEDMLSALRTGVIVLDDEHREIEANPAAERLLGDQRDVFRERVRALESEDEIHDGEIVLHRAEGPRTLRVVVSPTLLEDRRRGWLVVFDDVTELLASRRLSLYAQMARQVAHEVKNPLTPVQLSAQMIRQACRDRHPRLDEIVEENVGQIEGQVSRLRRIASEFALLGQERIDDVEELELLPLLEEIQTQYPSADGSLEIELDVEGAPRVLASRDGLTKVVANLVQNALQAMGGQGRILLRVRQQEDRVRLEVLDEGCGLDPEVEERLFEPYFSTKSTGTGLGLVICRNLMEKMGGSLALANRGDGPGAVATVHLPSVRRRSGNTGPATT